MPHTNDRVRWIGTAGGDWSDPGNWSGGAVPEAADDVVINTSIFQTITHDTGQDTVNALLVGADAFQLSGGTLDIVTTGDFRDGFSQIGGTLMGAALDMRWADLTGGSLAGASTLTTYGPATISDYALDGAVVWLEYGGATQTGAVTLGGESGGATLTNAAGATYRIGGGYDVLAGSSSSSIVNAGRLMTSADGGTSVIGPSVTSTGTLLVAGRSTLELDGASNVIDGLVAGVGTLALGGSSSTSFGAGTITASHLVLEGSASATVSSNTAFSPDTLTLLGDASISISGSRTYSGTLDIRSVGMFGGGTEGIAGITLTGADNVLMPSVGDLTIDETNLTNMGTTSLGGVSLSSCEITNYGTVEQLQSVGSIPTPGGLVIIDNRNGAIWNVSGPVSLGTATDRLFEFNNEGGATLSVDAKQGIATLGISNLYNNGTIHVASGTLQLDPGTFLLNGSGGTITGSALELVGNAIMVIEAQYRLDVRDLELRDNSVLIANHSFSYKYTLDDESNGTTQLRLEGNTITLLGPAYFIGTNGSAVIGNVANTPFGTLVTQGTTQLGGALIETATFQNQGMVNAIGELTIGASGTPGAFSNLGIYDLLNDTGIALGASMGGSFVNSGLFEKTSGTGTSVISAPFTNTGTIMVSSGTVEFTAGSLVNMGTIVGDVSEDSQGNIFITHS